MPKTHRKSNINPAVILFFFLAYILERYHQSQTAKTEPFESFVVVCVQSRIIKSRYTPGKHGRNVH